MEREEGEDMIFLLVLWVGGRREYIFSFPICVQDVNRRRVESSRACLSVCLVAKSK